MSCHAVSCCHIFFLCVDNVDLWGFVVVLGMWSTEMFNTRIEIRLASVIPSLHHTKTYHHSQWHCPHNAVISITDRTFLLDVSRSVLQLLFVCRWHKAEYLLLGSRPEMQSFLTDSNQHMRPHIRTALHCFV